MSVCLLGRVCLRLRQGTMSGWLGRPNRGEGQGCVGRVHEGPDGLAGLCRHGGERSRWGPCRCVWMGPGVVGVGLASLSGLAWQGVALGPCSWSGCVTLCPLGEVSKGPLPRQVVSKPPS